MEKNIVSVSRDALLVLLAFHDDVEYADSVLKPCQNEGFREQVKLMYQANIVKNSIDILRKEIEALSNAQTIIEKKGAK